MKNYVNPVSEQNQLQKKDNGEKTSYTTRGKSCVKSSFDQQEDNKIVNKNKSDHNQNGSRKSLDHQENNKNGSKNILDHHDNNKNTNKNIHENHDNKFKDSMIQNAFLNHCRHEGIVVEINLISNIKHIGYIVGFDYPTIVIKNLASQQILLMKSAIIDIIPQNGGNYIFNDTYKMMNNPYTYQNNNHVPNHFVGG